MKLSSKPIENLEVDSPRYWSYIVLFMEEAIFALKRLEDISIKAFAKSIANVNFPSHDDLVEHHKGLIARYGDPEKHKFHAAKLQEIVEHLKKLHQVE